MTSENINIKYCKYLYIVMQVLQVFLTTCEKFCESKPQMSSRLFDLSNEIHDGIFLGFSSRKYSYLIVPVFIARHASIQTLDDV